MTDTLLNDLKVFKLCKDCNEEFELTMGKTSNQLTHAFQKCPHCGKRNDTWIEIRLTKD